MLQVKVMGLNQCYPLKSFLLYFTTWNSNIQWTLPGNVSVSRSMIFVDKSLVVLLNSVLLFLQLCLLFRLSMADLGLGFPLPFVWSPWSWLVHSMKKACGRSRQVTPYDTADFKHFYQKLSDFWQAKVTIIWPSAKLETVCCKKLPKIVPDQLLVWEIRAFWRFWTVSNWS